MNKLKRQKRLILIILLSIGLLFILGTSFTQLASVQPTDRELVEQFFPQHLIDDAVREMTEGLPTELKQFDFAVTDLNKTGQAEFIVAAYSNGYSGVVRVLKKQNNSAVLVFEPDLPLMGGSSPKILLRDLDLDDRLDVVVSFASARGSSADWIFKWDGARLALISPTEVTIRGTVSTVLSNTQFADLNRDGVVDIVSQNYGELSVNETSDIAPLSSFDVFVLQEGSYTFIKPLVFFDSLRRSPGQPIERTRVFAVDRPNHSYELKVINGDYKGGRRVSSAVIRLNGIAIIGRDSFNQTVPEITRGVTLQHSNTLSVELAGAPNSEIIVTIEPKP